MNTPSASPHWIDRLSDYIDGELSPADVVALENHLGACDVCSSALTELRAVVAQLRAAPSVARDDEIERIWPLVRRHMMPQRRVQELPSQSGRLARQVLAAGLWLSIGAAGGWWMERAQCVARTGNAPILSAGIVRVVSNVVLGAGTKLEP